MVGVLDKAPGYPFVRDGGGIFPMLTGDALKAADIIQAVFTPIGTRPMAKSLGSEIDKLLFLNELGLENIPDDANPMNSLAKAYIQDAVDIAEINAEIVGVIVRREDDNATLKIEVQYTHTDYDNLKKLTITYPTNRIETEGAIMHAHITEKLTVESLNNLTSLKFTPVDRTTVKIYVEGLLYEYGEAYTIGGAKDQTIYWNASQAGFNLETDMSVRADYHYKV